MVRINKSCLNQIKFCLSTCINCDIIQAAMKKIWISVVVFSFLALGVGTISAAGEHCLYTQHGRAGDYTAYICEPTTTGFCTPLYNKNGLTWGLYGGRPYSSKTACEDEGEKLIPTSGYCYTDGYNKCEIAKPNECLAYSKSFYKDLASCEKENLDKDVYCHDIYEASCQHIEYMGKANKCGDGNLLKYHKYYGKSKSENETDCNNQLINHTAYCYVDGKCVLMKSVSRGVSRCNSSGKGELANGSENQGQVVVSKSTAAENLVECQKKVAAEGKYCLYKRVTGSGDYYLCEKANGSTCGSVPSGQDDYSTTIYTFEQGPMSQEQCLNKKKEGICCMYVNDSGSHTCTCGTSTLGSDGKCLPTTSNGSLKGTYTGKTDCENARPGELPKFKVDEPTEQLSHETLEKMNPLRHSLPNVFGNQSNRNPGYIISRLVTNIIFPISGLILFIQIIWAGFQVVQGGTTGNDNQVNSGKQRLISVIVGFLLLFASYWLWSLVELIFGIGVT